MGERCYHFEAVTENNSLVGFILWWEFDDIRYIEHFAVSPGLRGEGYGRQILKDFITDSDVPVLLEVEHPTDETSRRRIGFYEKAGFILNEHSYTHPSYRVGGENVPLMVMTMPATITENELRRFEDRHHPVIHEYVLSRDRKLHFGFFFRPVPFTDTEECFGFLHLWVGNNRCTPCSALTEYKVRIDEWSAVSGLVIENVTPEREAVLREYETKMTDDLRRMDEIVRHLEEAGHRFTPVDAMRAWRNEKQDTESSDGKRKRGHATFDHQQL